MSIGFSKWIRKVEGKEKPEEHDNISETKETRGWVTQGYDSLSEWFTREYDRIVCREIERVQGQHREEYTRRILYGSRYSSRYSSLGEMGLHYTGRFTSRETSEPIECNQTSRGQTRVQGFDPEEF